MKYTGKEHTNHLMAIPKEHYTISYNWNGSRYLGHSSFGHTRAYIKVGPKYALRYIFSDRMFY